MQITILNGNPAPSDFDVYLSDLGDKLTASGHDLTLLILRDLSLKYCTGCFECWTKAPGLCDHDQASQEMGRAVVNSDFTLWAAPLKMGFPSAVLKMALDKHLPLIHPYMVVDQGEAHHLKRYEKYPRLGLLVEKESGTTARDLEIIRDIFARTALNFKSKLEFMDTTELEIDKLSQKIAKHRGGRHLFPRQIVAIPGAKIVPPKMLTLFNGSPRGKNGNTPLMLEQFQKGFGSVSEIHHLVISRDQDKHLEAFQQAECVWLGFPLYTDAMPGLVKSFLEALEAFQDRGKNPSLGFLVQSGFPEGVHSRYVERYLAALAGRLGSPYLGTIIKGNGEGTRLKPESLNSALFDNLADLGARFEEHGMLDRELLDALAKPERYPRVLGPVFSLFLRSKMAHSYFDQFLVENQAYDQRNVRPLIHNKS